MIRLILAATIALTLSACSTTPTPVVPRPAEMPALPAPLNQRAQSLPPLVATDLHGHIRDGARSDQIYNDLRDRHNAVLTAWDCVRGALLDGGDAKACFGGSR